MQVIGIWFYDKPECQEIVRLLQQVFENSAEPAEKQPQPHGDPAAFGSARNLTNLLMNVASKVAVRSTLEHPQIELHGISALSMPSASCIPANVLLQNCGA